MADSARYRARLDDGLCGACGTDVHEPERTKCEGCLETARVATAARRAYARQRGLCEACLRVRAAKGRGRRCSACADKYLAAQLERDRSARRRRRKLVG
jgi:hypothetical protein